jgi:HD-GYP domain-containing protein (c-di-GMP phosphodiesterase class II)
LETSKPKSAQAPLQSPAHDPLEAIYALNIGDFVAESFISDDLLHKISQRLADNPNKLKAQLEELIHIYSIDKTLGILGLDTQAGFLIYDSIAATLAQMFQVDACHLFQAATKDNGEQVLSLTGTSITLDSAQRWEIGVNVKALNFFSDVYRGLGTQAIEDVSRLPSWKPIGKLQQEKTRSLLATPLQDGHRTTGVLVFESYTATAFTPETKHLAEITATVFVTSTRLQQLIAQAQEQVRQPAPDVNTLVNLRAQITESIADLGVHQQAFAESLANAVDARHNFSRGHSQMVARLARAIAETLELNEKTIDLVYTAGLVGSIGKVHIPRELTGKTGGLAADEWERLRDHPNVGVSLLAKINFLSEVSPYVHSQNERWDGSGSPEGLRGRSIPLGSRILAVANAYYGMTQERPYRGEPMTHAKALETLQQEAGAKWDPLVVEALAKISPEAFK